MSIEFPGFPRYLRSVRAFSLAARPTARALMDRAARPDGGGSSITRLFGRLTLLAALVAVALMLGAQFGGVFEDAELATVDTRFDLRGSTEPPAELVVVAVDAATFDLGLQWPFPRGVHAELINEISQDRPAVIVYDVQFTERTVDEEDNRLIEAVANVGSVVLATTEVADDGSTGIFGGLDLAELGARAGSALFAPDPGGVVRKLTLEVEGLSALAVAAAETATGRHVPRTGAAEEWIDFHGSPGSIPTISFSAALKEEPPDGFYADKIVIVGASAPSLKDLHTTSTTSGEFMSGPELEAHAISTVLRGFPLRSSPSAVDIALLVALGFVPALIARRLRIRWLIPSVALLCAAYLIAVQLAFNEGVSLPVLYPLVAFALSTVAVVGLTATASRLERERARALFARFVPGDVVDDVLLKAGDDLRLGGVELDGTALFVDLRGFTGFVDDHGPEDVLRVLNEYLETVSGALHEHGGTVVSFQGDGVMGVFGAPLEQPDHASRALACARSLVLEGLPRFNGWLEQASFDVRFDIGVGVASGTLRSGNVGSTDRVEYAAIGDATNTAARLQAMTREAEVAALIAESVIERLAAVPTDLVDIGQRTIRGKSRPVRLFALRAEGEGGRSVPSTLAG